MSASNPSTVDVTTEEQLRVVADAHSGPVLLYFHAKWCTVCKATWPQVEKALKSQPTILTLKVDVEKAEEIADAWGVQGMPTFFYAKAGPELKAGKTKEVAFDLLLGIIFAYNEKSRRSRRRGRTP